MNLRKRKKIHLGGQKIVKTGNRKAENFRKNIIETRQKTIKLLGKTQREPTTLVIKRQGVQDGENYVQILMICQRQQGSGKYSKLVK